MADTVLGIDFGSMYLVAVAAASGAEAASIASRSPAVAMPGAVYFEIGGRVLVGEEAVQRASNDPERAVVGVREAIGDARWKRKIDRKKLHAPDLARLLLESLAARAASGGASVSSAVLTVPAFAHDGVRQELRDAAGAAGLPVGRVLNEPSAAALAYAATTELGGRVLVYGLGHDFDATVVHVNDAAEVSVLASDGERAGRDAVEGVPVGATERAILRALDGAEIATDSIEAVVLQGERALEPGVDEMLRRLFGREPLVSIAPVEVVARGAAIVAASQETEARGRRAA